MTNEEAIKVLNTIDNCLKGNGYDWEHEGIKTAIQALEKQIPKKPALEGDGYSEGELVIDTWYCPNCDAAYELDYYRHKYCPECGQRINWDGQSIESEE